MGPRETTQSLKKKALAIYIALKHFEKTIEGYHISIITDHAPLVHIFDVPHKALSPRLKRWASYMQSFSYKIQYHEGKTHYLADHVSRLDTDITLPENDDPDLGIDCLFPQDYHTFQSATVTRSNVTQKQEMASQNHTKTAKGECRTTATGYDTP